MTPTSSVPENEMASCATGSTGRKLLGSRWSRLARTLTSERWLVRWMALLLLGLYVRSVAFAPVYDDNVMSSWSPRLSDIGQFFRHDIFGSDGTAHSVYYRPVAMTWEFLIAYFTGGAPGWMHLTSVLLHIVVVLLAYQFGRLLFRDWRVALLTAVLFGVHPSKVESVAWVGSSCVDALAAAFFFGSLITFLKWFEGKSPWMLTVSVALFGLAMFSKETMVFVPILIAIYLWLASPRAERLGNLVKTLPLYGAVWAVYMAIRHQVIKPVSATAEYIHPTYSHENLWTAPYAIWWYLRHLVAPWGLCVEYAAKVLQRPTLTGFVLPGLALVVLLAIVLWIWNKQRSPVVALLICWFGLTLAPPVVVAPMVSQHDRYLYIAAYAFCAQVAYAILHAGEMRANVRLAFAMGTILLWSGLTWHEMGYWDCDRTLWTRVLQVAPSQPKAQLQLASIYAEEKNIPEAIRIIDDGLRYRPGSVKMWLARAGILFQDKQFDQSRVAYQKVMDLTAPAEGQPVAPGLVTVQRASAAYQLAVLEEAAGHILEADRNAAIALALDPKGVGYHAVLGKIRARQGRADEARKEVALELQLRLEQQRSQSLRANP